MKGKSYKVIKAHKSFKEGDSRTMHPNLAKLLAKKGLVELCKGDDKKKVKKSPSKAKAKSIPKKETLPGDIEDALKDAE